MLSRSFGMFLIHLHANSCFSLCSGVKEDWYLPTSDCMIPCIVELKAVPNSAGLVIGHNGFGEFGIWYVLPFAYQNYILTLRWLGYSV